MCSNECYCNEFNENNINRCDFVCFWFFCVFQTALDINPLLSFVRTPSNAMPFNSVDLSLPPSAVNPNLNQTAAVSANANRNSLTPSPRNLVSPGSGSSSSARFPKLTSDSEESANNGTNKMDVKLNTDPIAFLNEMSEQIASMRSSRNMAPSNAHSRDSNPSHNDLSNFRINGGNDKVMLEKQ